MDKEWTKLPRFSPEYINGVESFLDFAYTKGRPQGGEMLCPCAKCRNRCWKKRNVIYDHLIGSGFLKGYSVWVNHGEEITLTKGLDSEMVKDDQEDTPDNVDGLLDDTFMDVIEAKDVNNGPNEDASKFYNLVQEANQELYPGCKNFSTLSFAIRMYLLKCHHGWSNASFNALLQLLKEAMPELTIPESFDKTKAMIKDLGLDYEKIHACLNDCTLFWEEHEKADSCPVCEASQRKEFPQIKSNHFRKYSSLQERLRHSPEMIPEPHSRQLMSYSSNTTVQDISKKNAVNRIKQKYMHPMGPKKFARVRNELRVEKGNGEDVCQAEMFTVTRQSRKGKQVDPETNTVVDKLEDSFQNSTKAAEQTFQSIFGEEKPHKVRRLGRTMTPTMSKKNQEIASIKKEIAELNNLSKRLEGLEALTKFVLRQTKLDLNDEVLNNIMEVSNINSAAHPSSTSTHFPK